MSNPAREKLKLAPTTGAKDRVFTTPDTPSPEVHVLSNGRYHVAITAAGGGYSRWRDLAVTRWHEDPTRDCWGSFCYLRDAQTGEFWSATHQPTLKPAAKYEAIFSNGRADFRRRDGEIETHVEISVSPEDDIELRRVSITNHGGIARTIELTTYAEVVLAPPAVDAAHPAFSNLFVQSEIIRNRRAIVCTRRPRSASEQQPWMMHLMAVHGTAVGETSYETSRADFIGRGRSVADPAAMHVQRLGDSEGSVLDPVIAIRSTILIEPNETASVHIVTGAAETRDGVLELIEKYHDRREEVPTTRSVPVSKREPQTLTDFERAGSAGKDLLWFNGVGGFTSDGREYVITTTPDLTTPAPWVNVLANPFFGTIISESGGAYTFCENANQYRLTPWNNDHVTDASGEAFYIRDEETGRFWSPTPLPARGAMPYTARHGFGYSSFEYTESGITSQMQTYVAMDAPVKFVVIRIRNGSGKARRFSTVAFFELVLGMRRPENVPHIVTETDPKTGALFARNPHNDEVGERVAFLDVSETQRSVTGDRTEFLGRNGSPANPAAMHRPTLSGRVGDSLDPCLSMQVTVDVADGEEREIVFTFGSGRDLVGARDLIHHFRGSAPARAALEDVQEYWNRTLGAVQVKTPDASLNVLANGWLLYQVLACRMWARSGFYQSGGAFGFRDQLQDAMSLVHAEPAMLREHLLRCASRQFREGDVQHWWHPPSGRGMRTRMSDDYLWLPYATCRYVNTVGDTGVLDETAQYLEGRAVKPDEHDYYGLPTRSAESGTLYGHCVRAIRYGLKFGEHGLPLMGTGDWNDGMNLVGEHGRGESVWLAFFLYDVLVQFAPIAKDRSDSAFAELCTAEARKLRENIERHAWDGAWYRRAYFDNGEPLGSASSPECKIDSLPQSWSVLSGASPNDRSRASLEALDKYLVKRDDKLIQLFDPPFDQSSLNPGYIKGYVPGVRENGGQYTHAAVWAVMAFAAARDVDRAWELFRLIDPIRHGDTQESIARYKVEPYVIAADVYTNPQHVGRGGWTWYTGSAGWMYRLITESLLGLRLESDRLHINPLFPPEWNSFEVHYRHRDTMHHIIVRNVSRSRTVAAPTVTRVLSDGVEQPSMSIPLSGDGREHHAEVEVGGPVAGQT